MGGESAIHSGDYAEAIHQMASRRVVCEHLHRSADHPELVHTIIPIGVRTIHIELKIDHHGHRSVDLDVK
jgi:hypothetical protein